MSAAPLRIGLFGGAFDPPHDAHVALALAAINQLALDRLCLMTVARDVACVPRLMMT